MDKKSIVFIEPTVNKTNVFENYMRLPLMGTLYLGTILHNEGLYKPRFLNRIRKSLLAHLMNKSLKRVQSTD